jgi:hypothetical protein
LSGEAFDFHQIGAESVSMDVMMIVRAGFMGFTLALGVQILVFYLAGSFLGVARKAFIRVFVLAAIASFLAVDALLYYRIHILQAADATAFLAACVGGWLSGLIFGFMQMRPYLARLLK